MKIKDAIRIVLDDLLYRIPKTNLDGFLADDEVYEAISKLQEHIGGYDEREEKTNSK